MSELQVLAAQSIGLVYEGIKPISLLSRPVAVMVNTWVYVWSVELLGDGGVNAGVGILIETSR